MRGRRVKSSIVNWLNNVNERRKGKERYGERGKVWRGKIKKGSEHC